MITEPNSLLAQVLGKKYIGSERTVAGFKDKSQASALWRGLVKASPILNKGVRAKVGNGRSTLFWMDCWLQPYPLLSKALVEINLVEQYKRVADYWVQDMGWNWAVLRNLLPTEILNMFAAFVLRPRSTQQDSLCWGLSTNGLFSVKTAYLSQRLATVGSDSRVWKVIWKLSVPQRIRSFLWMVNHERVMCNVERVRRGFTSDSLCPICHQEEESLVHLFRDCTAASQIWTALAHDEVLNNGQVLDFKGWLIYNLTQVNSLEFQSKWGELFAIALWWIWKWRCNLVFRQESVSIGFRIQWLKTQFYHIDKAMQVIDNALFPSSCYKTILIGWTPPNEDWLKLRWLL